MNYARIYYELVERARIESEERRIGGSYHEEHHVIPRCLVPSSKFTVPLTAREHILAHALLVKFFPNVKLMRASSLMGVRKGVSPALRALSRERLGQHSWTKTDEGKQKLKESAIRLAKEGRNGFQSQNSRKFSSNHAKGLQQKWVLQGNHPLSTPEARERSRLMAIQRNKEMNAELNKAKGKIERICDKCGAVIKGPLGNMKQHQRSSKCCPDER